MNPTSLHADHLILMDQNNAVFPNGAVLAGSDGRIQAVGEADEILAKTPDYYSALDAKGLALCGLAICGGKGDPSMPAGTNASKTIQPDKATVGDGWVAPSINDAIETFQTARKIAPHAGVVKSVLRLFGELVKCDEEGVLKDVREVIEGK